jgi:tRNA threonylcarbamoyladenosine biosynthesis protein TsaB
MPLLLNIDTATEHASVCLSNESGVLLLKESHDQKNHGAFLQPAIQQILLETGIAISTIDAISVSEGPGSYTGLRVGLASAKGLCYALQKPLIAINTLTIMAYAAINQNKHFTSNTLFCPMIDARRMEVFTALYDIHLQPIEAPNAKILDKASFEGIINEQPIVFSGNGSIKMQTELSHTNAIFSLVQHTAAHLSALAYQSFKAANFVELAYFEPFYLKAFYSPPPKK